MRCGFIIPAFIVFSVFTAPLARAEPYVGNEIPNAVIEANLRDKILGKTRTATGYKVWFLAHHSGDSSRIGTIISAEIIHLDTDVWIIDEDGRRPYVAQK